MSSEQLAIPSIRGMIEAVGQDLDRLRGGEDVQLTAVEEGEGLFPGLDSVQLARKGTQSMVRLREQVRTTHTEVLQEQVTSARKQIQRLDVSPEERRQEMTAPIEDAFVVAGRVVDVETGEPLPGLRIQAMERDPENDDELGEQRTDSEGYYRMVYTEENFHGALDEEPETYVRVLSEEGNVLFTSDQSYRHSAGTVEVIDVALEGSKVPGSREARKEFLAYRKSKSEALQCRMKCRQLLAGGGNTLLE